MLQSNGEFRPSCPNCYSECLTVKRFDLLEGLITFPLTALHCCDCGCVFSKALMLREIARTEAQVMEAPRAI